MNREPESPVDWPSVQDDLDIVGKTRANLLIIGPDRLVVPVVSRVVADLPYSLIACPCDARRLLLALLPPGRAVVLRDIDRLDADGQAALFEWVERASGEQQIICTGSGLLPALMNSGQFDPRLYYRLNTVCIDLANSR